MKKFLTYLLGLISAVVLMSVQPATVLAAPPANFQTTQIIGSGLNGPSGFDIAPDGRIFILQRTGEVLIYKNNQLLSQPFAVLPSVATGDRGLIGVAFDPNFISNHWVYFYYTSTDLHNYLVRFDATGDVGTNGPVIIYQTPDTSELLHVGGSIRFGADGKLYFAIGDNGYGPNSQDLGNAHGKILRINSNGTIPSDNPFVGQAGKLPEIWAYGFRNPWRFTFDSSTGFMYAGDVGEATWEEADRVVKGQNYGWPVQEGACNGCSYTNPIYTYNHDNLSSAITMGPVYRSSMFPSQYYGNVFFGDYARGFIRTMGLDANGNSTGVADFDTQAGSVVDLKVAFDGSLYYITYYPGRLYRVTYSTSNHVPIANATSDVTKGTDPLTVHFSSAGSSDPDNDTLHYVWDFGDGTTSTNANPTKIYSNKGTYTVELTVNDGVNNAQAVPIVIQVGIPPTIIVGAPTDGSSYKAGDTINYSFSAVDGAGNDVNDGNLVTEVVFHHLTHIHPFLGPIQSRNGTFQVPTQGEPSPYVWFELKFTATDVNGLSTTKSVNIYPQTSNMTFQTNPAGLQILLNGEPVSTPQTITGVVGFQRELDTLVMQGLNGNYYEFDHWSDGGSQKHFLTTPATDSTFTAFFKAGSPFSAQYFNNMTLSGTPVLTRNEAMINNDWGYGSPDPSVNADNFSARWTKNHTFDEGDYQFSATADDGVRLYIDNALVINQWHDQGTTAYTFSTHLSVGQHAIKMEYYENSVGAVSKLNWSKVSLNTSPTPTITPTSISTPTPTRTPTPTPSGNTANIAPNGTGYRWSKNSSSTQDTNKVAAPGMNDGNTSQDVSLSGGVDDNANGWEAGGVIWNSSQSGITSVEYINGSWTASANGAFTAGFKLQYTTDGTTWTDSGWACTPAYNYDSASTSGIKYTCSGSAITAIGMRITGQVHTTNALSWYANAREINVLTTNGGATVTPTRTPTPSPTVTPSGNITNIAPNGTGYRWSKNSSSTQDTNKVAAPGMNDGNTSQDVSLSGGVDDNANGWEAGGVIWNSSQSGITSVEYINGSWTASANGAFTAGFKLQYTTDGTTWTDSGWACTPAYNYDSASTSGIKYTCTGNGLTALGLRLVGQVRTVNALSWYANAREMYVWITNTSATVTPTRTPTPSPTASPSPTPGGNTANIAPNGTGYRWSKNSSSTQDTNKVAAPGMNDGNTSQDVSLSGGVDDNANGWEAGGVIWNSSQSGITSVEYINGSWTASANGAFSANMKLQQTNDGTTWTDTGWTCTPAYNYDSASTSGIKYTCTGNATNARGVRVVGQVRTANALSWFANAREINVFVVSGIMQALSTPISTPTLTPSPSPTMTPTPVPGPSNTPTPTPTVVVGTPTGKPTSTPAA